MSEALSAYNAGFKVQGFDPKPAALLVAGGSSEMVLNTVGEP